MDDTISRQAAIDTVSKACEECRGIFARCEKGLKALPSAAMRLVDVQPTIKPEHKKGKWIDYSDEGYVECPFCHSATNCDGNKDELHFCFSCGADMRTKETDCDYERAVEQLEHDMLYEPTFNQDDGSM